MSPFPWTPAARGHSTSSPCFSRDPCSPFTQSTLQSVHRGGCSSHPHEDDNFPLSLQRQLFCKMLARSHQRVRERPGNTGEQLARVLGDSGHQAKNHRLISMVQVSHLKTCICMIQKSRKSKRIIPQPRPSPPHILSHLFVSMQI